MNETAHEYWAVLVATHDGAPALARENPAHGPRLCDSRNDAEHYATGLRRLGWRAEVVRVECTIVLKGRG